jgi:hypothetical protein
LLIGMDHVESAVARRFEAGNLRFEVVLRGPL